MEEHRTADLAVDLAVTNLVLLVPILAMARRRTLPFGLATAVYTTAATLSGALTGFRNGDLLLGVIVAGVGVDLLARLLRPGPRRPIRCRVFAAAAALLTWTTYIAMAYLTCPPLYQPVTAIPEVVTGAPIVQALLALLVSVLLPPGEGSNRQARRNAERHGNAAGTARRATVR